MEPNGISRLTVWGVLALIVAGFLFVPILFEAYQIGRGSDGCAYRWFDIPWDQTWALEAVHGGFSWWPTGLTCTFPIRGAEDYVVSPSPWQSVQLVAAIVVGLGGVAALVLAAIKEIAAKIADFP